MKRWAAVTVVVGLIIGTVAVAPAATGGTGATPTRGQPVIASSDRTTCAVRESHRVYCFGANSQGELGRGDTAPSTTVAPTSSVLLDAIAVYGSATYSGGGGAFCALKTNRTIACWGDGENYRLGNGLFGAATTPAVVSGLTGVASVGMGETTTCVAKQDGTVWCVGSSGFIVPGAPTSFTKLAGVSGAVSVAVGANFACVLKIDRSVWCWGVNHFGQLGNGNEATSAAPTKVVGLTDATALAAGGDHACALRAGGSVSCWGYNDAGRLGYVPAPAAGYSTKPLTVSNLSGAKTISAGYMSTCATTATAVKCWGYGGNYNLGDSQTSSQYAPVYATASLDSPTMVAVGVTTTCEIASGARIWCWGANVAGEAGNNLTGAVPDGAGPWNTFGYALPPRAVAITNSAPGTPTGSSTVARKIKITWTAPSTSNGTSAPKDYVIYYQLKGSTTWKKFTDTVTATRSATVTGLTSGKYYRFKVVPVNWAGAGTTSGASAYVKSR